MEEHNAVVDARRNLIEECGKAVDEIKARQPGCWAEWLLPELFALHMELLNSEAWMTSCTGCAASFDGQYAETIRAETAERDLAEALAALEAERATTARLLEALADAERFVEQLLVSKTAVQWGALFLLKEGTTRLPARVVAEELLAALRSARGVGEEG